MNIKKILLPYAIIVALAPSSSEAVFSVTIEIDPWVRIEGDSRNYYYITDFPFSFEINGPGTLYLIIRQALGRTQPLGQTTTVISLLSEEETINTYTIRGSHEESFEGISMNVRPTEPVIFQEIIPEGSHSLKLRIDSEEHQLFASVTYIPEEQSHLSIPAFVPEKTESPKPDTGTLLAEKDMIQPDSTISTPEDKVEAEADPLPEISADEEKPAHEEIEDIVEPEEITETVVAVRTGDIPAAPTPVQTKEGEFNLNYSVSVRGLFSISELGSASFGAGTGIFLDATLTKGRISPGLIVDFIMYPVDFILSQNVSESDKISYDVRKIPLYIAVQYEIPTASQFYRWSISTGAGPVFSRVSRNGNITNPTLLDAFILTGPNIVLGRSAFALYGQFIYRHGSIADPSDSISFHPFRLSLVSSFNYSF